MLREAVDNVLFGECGYITRQCSVQLHGQE